ncbi:MAG: multidrug ABC transporter substrate-binding protein [Acidobacteria bacterium]|nr:MAG: multidrug ABC transporter substrate-binding protein [Acidobacteriota bacterium]
MTSTLWLPDLGRSLENLLLHKLRTLLTMLGMIFGVAAVVAMLSIGAGAQQQVMAFIEDLGVRNLIVEARETTEFQAFQKVRQQSPGLTFKDMRAMQATVPGLELITPRKRFIPSQVIPKPQGELPAVYGVEPIYRQIAGLKVGSGRFFTDAEAARAAPICVLGDAARVRLFGLSDPIGRFVKVNGQWYQTIGVAAAQAVAQADVPGLPSQDRNNVVYVPTGATMFRLEDNYSQFRDEIDGVYMRLKPDADVIAAAATVRGILTASHRGVEDYSLVVPAELLAEQQRTKRIFDVVMVALASISLLVGGIGIMNIMLASVLERTREIGVRRAIGARRTDIIRQFVMETTLIAVAGGTLGLLLGASMSRLIASFAGWSTIISSGSLALAFSVSVLIGLVSGVYPAMKASRLDPVEALHYE